MSAPEQPAQATPAAERPGCLRRLVRFGVRATVVDAMCHGFAPVVPADCVGDRAIGPHEANLFDMEQKYADVTSLDHVLGELERIGLRNEA